MFRNQSETKFRHIDTGVIEGFKDFLESPQCGLTGETPYDYFARFKRATKHTEKYLTYVVQLKTDAVKSLPNLD